MPQVAATTTRHGLSAPQRALVTLVALAVLLPSTFGVSLVDRDEGWYAQVAREMLDSGDWLIPTYLGEPWIAKPPLLYWCVAAMYAIFGVHAWAARLVSVLATLGAVHLLATIAADLYNRRVALIASIAFITAGLPAIVGRLVLTDALLLVCMMAATVTLWRMASQGATWLGGAQFWIWIGLSILAKGPAVIVFVGALALGLLARRETRAWIRCPRFWLTLPIALLVAGPWYAYANAHAGGVLLRQFFGYEIASRLTGSPHGHGGPPGYYLLISLAGWLPWTALVPGAVCEALQRRRDDAHTWPLLIWFAAPWLLLELIPSKLPHYILPCYVPLAILFGRMWDLGLEHQLTRGQRVVLQIWAVVPIMLGVALLAAACHWWGLAWTSAAAIGGALLALGFLLAAVKVRRHQLWKAWCTAATITIAFHVVLGAGILRDFEPYRLSRNIAAAANEVSGPHTAIYLCGYDEPSTFFYLNRPAEIVPWEQLPALLASDDDVVLIAGKDQLQHAGIDPVTAGSPWRRVCGFNYVKGEWRTIWVSDRTP